MNSPSEARHRVAGQSIWFSPAIPELAPFSQNFIPPPSFQRPPNLLDGSYSSPVVQAEGWIADRLETISVWRDEHGILMEIPSAGRYWTSADGTTIQQVSGLPDLDPAILSQSLLGPPLVLALALRGVWCLHASAITLGDRIAIFLGNSGMGKSTLAAFINEQPDARRLGDDILPIEIESGGVYALPHFPQLKLPLDKQPGLNFPERLPLSAVYLLDEGTEIGVEALKPTSAALTLASHTVAARLFDRTLLSAHLDFCIQAAGCVPVRRFTYPRVLTELPAVWQALQADLKVLHA